ncbi:MAG: hypothetical protein ABS36_05740 [Acidobacteria bacterium SCN 69-37]|nr:MAG: hypothetical protein ABS36_05740 [Acidobacteria bacterium SCN 69-37]
MDRESPSPAEALSARVRAGDARAVARALSVVERAGIEADDLDRAIYRHTGRAVVIGVTGAPGAGKSTLVGRIVASCRQAGRRVAVLAIDPTSPFTGGALLGDRVRMQEHALDDGVFIRSMATRGHLGGISAATASSIDVLDAAGFDVILIETVGVGQAEVEVARVADACVVVSVPGAGDDVQAMKAGIMEIADVHVVNKADREGADRAVAAIAQMLALDERTGRRPPIVRVVATIGSGIDDLMAALATCERDDDLRRARRRQRAEWRLTVAVGRAALARADSAAADDARWASAVAALDARTETPGAAAARWLARRVVRGRLDHVGIATASIDAGTRLYADLFDVSAGAVEDVAAQAVRVCFVDTGDARLELIEPRDPDADDPFAASLRKRGPGLHHVALRVADLDAVMAALAAKGVRLIDRVARPGAHGTRVAFVHPSSTGGVLIELVEGTDA